MAQALGRVAGSLRVSGEPAHLLGAGRADHVKFDGHVLEPGRCVVDVVLLGVAKRGADVSGRIFDRYLVQRREPRQLREQSKRCAHHQELQR
jgi:hypothetical protein